MERELCLYSDNGCLCNNSVSQAHLRKCFLSADWSQQRWGESTLSSQNVVCLLNLYSGQKCPTFSHWCRAVSTAAQLSSGARKGTTLDKMINVLISHNIHLNTSCSLIFAFQPQPLTFGRWAAAPERVRTCIAQEHLSSSFAKSKYILQAQFFTIKLILENRFVVSDLLVAQSADWCLLGQGKFGGWHDHLKPQQLFQSCK